jgi:exodeoxyribonuclease V gamma subunit
MEIEAMTIGRDSGSRSDTPRLKTVRLAPFPGDADRRRAEAMTWLQLLVDLYDRGMGEPLPLACETSAAWALESRRQGDVLRAAGEEWTSRQGSFPKEDNHPAHRLVWGESAPLDVLVRDRPGQDEGGLGWAMAESSRFGRLARRLWDGLLDHEVSGR